MTAAIAQETTAQGSATNTLTATLGSATVAGNVIVIGGASDAGYITGVSGRGATWASVGADSGSHTITSMWYGTGGSGTGNITITFGASGNQRAEVVEISGLQASPLDQHAGLTSATDSPVTQSITTTGAGIVVAYCGSYNTRASGPTNSYTPLTAVEPGAGVNLNGAYLLQGAGASTSTGWTVNASGGADTSIANFLETPPASVVGPAFIGGGFF